MAGKFRLQSKKKVEHLYLRVYREKIESKNNIL